MAPLFPTDETYLLQVSPLPGPAPVAAGAGLTAERLLQAAHELLHERAGGAVSVSEICGRAAVNVAMVKYCFGSKDGLMDALTERIIGSFGGDLAELDARTLTPRQTMERHVAAIVRNFLRFPYLSTLINERFRSPDPHVAQRLSKAFVIPASRWQAALLHAGQQDGAFRSVDPMFFFFSVIGASHFLFAARPWLEQGFGQQLTSDLVEHFVEHTTRLILEGIAAT